VRHWATDGLENEYFVRREVELDPRRITTPRQRAAIAYPALRTGVAARIAEDLESACIAREFDAGVFVHPIRNLVEDRLQKGGVEMVFVEHSEVEIFGEPIGFEIALLEAGAALEDPPISQPLVRRNPGQQPAQGVVLLDDMQVELELSGEVPNLLAVDH
jgi:hypothetical protein